VFTDDDQAEDPGFAVYREDAEYIGVSYGSRLEGRFAAENVKGHVKRGELITRAVSEAIDKDESIDGVRIMSVLSCSSPRGVSRKSYGVDPATGQLVSPHYPIGVIAAQSIGEPGTQLTLRSYHGGGSASADDITQGLPRVEELFEVRTPKGQAYLSDIAGSVKVWEDGDHYVVQITSDDAAKVTLELGGRTARIVDKAEVSVGDVLASGENDSNPLVAPIAGKAHVTSKSIVITPAEESIVKYEIPGF